MTLAPDLAARCHIKPFRPSLAMRLEPRVRWLRKLAAFVQEELTTTVRLPFPQRLRAWRHGFSSAAYAICALRDRELHLYVSDYEQNVRLARIIAPYGEMLGNKLNMTLLLQRLGVPCPTVHGLVWRGRLLPLDGSRSPATDAWFADRLQQSGRLVFKRLAGFKGLGFMVLERSTAGLSLNHSPFAPDDLAGIIAGLDDSIITDFVAQAPYAQAIYPATVNTVRALTLWDYDANHPFVVHAVHRFGSRRSVPVDNWQGGFGGLAAEVELETGILGPGVTALPTGQTAWYEAHPETGAAIKGVRVPDWAAALNIVRQAAAALPYLPVIGWDFVVTSSGPVVLEANQGPGLRIHQVHRPLLEDLRVRRFYRYHGLLSAWHRIPM